MGIHRIAMIEHKLLTVQDTSIPRYTLLKARLAMGLVAAIRL